MPYYIARIELRGTPSGTDYTTLHDAMQKQGFVRTITIGGKKWELPHAEYAWHTALVKSAVSIRDDLRPVIDAVYQNYLLLVSRADDVAGMLVEVK